MSQETQRRHPTPALIRSELQQAGLRPTSQHMATSQYVLNQANHSTAGEIKTWVDKRYPGISLGTVHNTVHALETAGLLQAIRFDHSIKILYDANTSAHFHFFRRIQRQTL